MPFRFGGMAPVTDAALLRNVGQQLPDDANKNSSCRDRSLQRPKHIADLIGRLVAGPANLPIVDVVIKAVANYEQPQDGGIAECFRSA